MNLQLARGRQPDHARQRLLVGKEGKVYTPVAIDRLTGIADAA